MSLLAKMESAMMIVQDKDRTRAGARGRTRHVPALSAARIGSHTPSSRLSRSPAAFPYRPTPCPSTRLLVVHLALRSPSLFSSVIFGKKIASEYISIGVLGGTAAIAMAASGGSKKDQPKSLAEKVEKAVPISAGSRCVCR